MTYFLISLNNLKQPQKVRLRVGLFTPAVFKIRGIPDNISDLSNFSKQHLGDLIMHLKNGE